MPALIDKPKMSHAMYEALKVHILRDRQRKKQEQEQDAAIEKLRRERENKQKRDVMTLEETKEQILQLEEKLTQQREEKHKLFLQLKKVLNEDETRRKARETSDLMSLGHFPIGAPNMFLQTGSISGRNLMFKSGPAAAPQQTIIPAGNLKRARSPSPPPLPYNYKVQANYTQKHGQYQGLPQQHYYVSPQPHSTPSSTYQTGSQPTYNYPSHGQFPPGNAASLPNQPPQVPSVVESTPKHSSHGYHMQHVQQPGGFMTPMHQGIEHPPKPAFGEEKYYAVPQHVAVPLRGMNTMHQQALIPIQQQSKPGGITSGYPIRSQQPPPSTSSYPTPTSTPQQIQYNAPPSGPRHGYANQPPPGRYY